MVEVKHKTTGKVLIRAKDSSLTGGVIKGKDLTGADFSDMTLTRVTFSGTNLGEANFRNAKLIDCKINNCVAKRSDFSDSVIDGCDFSDAIFDVSKFVGISAKKTRFRHSKINGGELAGGDFSEADFFFAELRADFCRAILCDANLFGADLTQADFSHADLRKVQHDGREYSARPVYLCKDARLYRDQWTTLGIFGQEYQNRKTPLVESLEQRGDVILANDSYWTKIVSLPNIFPTDLALEPWTSKTAVPDCLARTRAIKVISSPGLI